MDREKVVKGLNDIGGFIAGRIGIEQARNFLRTLDEAIAILKVQEAKAGTWQWKIHGKPESGGTIGEAICDQCGESTFATAVKGELNYCPNCGAKMKKLSAIK